MVSQLKYCQIFVIVEVKKLHFDDVINDQTPPPVINRKQLETPLPPRLIT